MLDSGVNARGGIGALDATQVDLWIDAAYVMVAASYQRTLAGKLNFFAIAKNQCAPGNCRIGNWLAHRFGFDWLSCRHSL